jgi:hypothetical protein
VFHPINAQACAFSVIALLDVLLLNYQYNCGAFQGISKLWARQVADLASAISETLPAYEGYVRLSKSAGNECLVTLFRVTAGIDVILFCVAMASSLALWRIELRSKANTFFPMTSMRKEALRVIVFALLSVFVGIEFFGDYSAVFPESTRAHFGLPYEYIPYLHAILILPLVIFAKVLIFQTITVACRIRSSF